jgi:hypothetical protein
MSVQLTEETLDRLSRVPAPKRGMAYTFHTCGYKLRGRSLERIARALEKDYRLYEDEFVDTGAYEEHAIVHGMSILSRSNNAGCRHVRIIGVNCVFGK